MTKIRNIVFVIVASCFGLLLFSFGQSVSSHGISSLRKPFNITASSNKFTSDEINKNLETFANKNNINIVKEFSVPKVGTKTRQAYYVLGKSHHFSKSQVIKSDMATRSEFLTSDLRYPLYVFGDVNQKIVSQELNRLGLSFQRSSDNWNWQVSDFLEDNYFDVFLELILLLLFLSLIVFNFKASRASNIMYLQGVSKLTIFKKRFIKDQLVFLSGYIAAYSINLIVLFSTHHWGVVWLVTYFALILYATQLIVYLIAGIIWSWSYNRATILPTIKGSAKNRLTLVIVLVVKTITEVIILASLLTLGQQLNTNQEIKGQVSTWSKLQERYSPSLSMNITSEEQDTEDKQTYKLVEWTSKHHGLISNYAGYNSAEGSGRLNFNDYSDYYNGGNVLVVNAEYLRLNHVMDGYGNKMSFNANDAVTHFLFPEKLKNQANRLTQKYVEQMGLSHMFKDGNAKVAVHLVKNNQNRLTYNPASLDMGYYASSVPDPVIIVVSPESLNGSNSDANRLWNAMMSNNAFSFTDYHKLNRKLVSLGMYKHIGGYTNIKSYASKIYQEQQSKVMQLSIILGLMIGLFVFECVLACSLYFGIYQRTHAIRTLMGQSLLKTHYRFGLVLAVLIISEWMLSLIVSHSLHLTSVYYLVDSLITFLIFYVKSKKNVMYIGASLKGDN
ncbi:hypothetical protein [Levilactobacillus suantsaiihabitans]|uniref:DUF1430 domain-containing protein n=1 Tax=Levilactobacillus suantsaiihabitans TaxID=2487722 RepID=A0A4Z0JC87_9LACO|nr:hypothetical protein [Levilactobacillus suantsaiihabitans]TGD19485.1 hypothetical protein EGT51_04780 [Levilactobacillus suantsaiihabitans]